jgi:hypothetical protein
VCPEPSMPFKHPCAAHAFFAEHFLSLPESPSHFSRYLHKVWRTLAVGFIAKMHQPRYTTPNKKT